MKYSLFFLLFFVPFAVYADESDLIKADRQNLAQAQTLGDTSKIFAAREQLSDDLFMEEEQRRQDLEGITIPLTPDGEGHLLANALINNDVPAELLVDTGSPVVMLTSSFAKKLGLDLSQAKVGYVEFLNGRYKAAAVSLDKVKLGEAQVSGVNALVLLEDAPGVNDGLLGLSFLSKFHFTLDQSGQKLILKKAENN